jgi:hypothetical protein
MTFSQAVNDTLNSYLEPVRSDWGSIREAVAAAACTVLGTNRGTLVMPVVECALDVLAARRAGHGVA